MPIQIIDITEAQADHLAKHEEGHFLDLKATEVSPAKLTKSMSAFANSDGGELFIGLTETEEGNLRFGKGSPIKRLLMAIFRPLRISSPYSGGGI